MGLELLPPQRIDTMLLQSAYPDEVCVKNPWRKPVTKREIKIPSGYDVETQKKVGLFAAQLDDQLKRPKNNVKGLTVKQLEWQQRPGMNTIGMLLAHLALVEVWWIRIAPAGIPWGPESKKIIQKSCGFEDDGLPLPTGGRHSKYLKNYSLKKVRIRADEGEEINPS